jgi:hypothetical protein
MPIVKVIEVIASSEKGIVSGKKDPIHESGSKI